MNQKIYDAVLFDMDGVLIDSLSVIEYAWQTAAAEHGKTLTRADFDHYIHGRTGAETLNLLFDFLPVAERKKIWQRVDEIEETAPYQAIAGVVSLVQTLQRHGVKLAVVTSSWPKKIAHALSCIDLAQAFGRNIITRNDITHGKPHPEPYLRGMALLGASQPLVFEDAISGVHAAVAAGADCIGVGDAALSEAGALGQIADFTQWQCREEQNLVILHHPQLPSETHIHIRAD